MLQEAINLREDASHIPAVKLYLGKALRKLGRSNEALLLAKEVLEQEIDKDLQVEGAWLVSKCAEDVGDIDQARKMLRLLLRRWARSARVPDARKRLGELNMRIWKKPEQKSTQ
jgi:tetratricopeptide (TPR) repeat protein